MSGTRIEKAKEALILFLKSLPTNSFFNVYSFGSNFTKLYNESARYEENTVESAINKI